jgi:hypothetical protein
MRKGIPNKNRSTTPARFRKQTADVQRLHVSFAFAHRFLTKSRIRRDRSFAGTSAHSARPPAPDACLPPLAPI